MHGHGLYMGMDTFLHFVDTFLHFSGHTRTQFRDTGLNNTETSIVWIVNKSKKRLTFSSVCSLNIWFSFHEFRRDSPIAGVCSSTDQKKNMLRVFINERIWTLKNMSMHITNWYKAHVLPAINIIRKIYIFFFKIYVICSINPSKNVEEC